MANQYIIDLSNIKTLNALNGSPFESILAYITNS